MKPEWSFARYRREVLGTALPRRPSPLDSRLRGNDGGCAQIPVVVRRSRMVVCRSRQALGAHKLLGEF